MRETFNTLSELAMHDGRYPEPAFVFVRDGLEHASRRIHGPITPAQFVIAQYLSAEHVDLDEVMHRRERGVLDPVVAAAIDHTDELQSLNRNVSGQDLCWGLRDYALQRWGNLAGLVLRRWHLTRTEDFGNIVFAMVKHGFMQTESHDSIDDFKSVYSFNEALDNAEFDGDPLNQ